MQRHLAQASRRCDLPQHPRMPMRHRTQRSGWGATNVLHNRSSLLLLLIPIDKIKQFLRCKSPLHKKRSTLGCTSAGCSSQSGPKHSHDVSRRTPVFSHQLCAEPKGLREHRYHHDLRRARCQAQRPIELPSKSTKTFLARAVPIDWALKALTVVIAATALSMVDGKRVTRVMEKERKARTRAATCRRLLGRYGR